MCDQMLPDLSGSVQKSGALAETRTVGILLQGQHRKDPPQLMETALYKLQSRSWIAGFFRIDMGFYIGAI